MGRIPGTGGPGCMARCQPDQPNRRTNVMEVRSNAAAHHGVHPLAVLSQLFAQQYEELTSEVKRHRQVLDHQAFIQPTRVKLPWRSLGMARVRSPTWVVSTRWR